LRVALGGHSSAGQGVIHLQPPEDCHYVGPGVGAEN
jgi:hypothetical protein